MRTPRWLSGAAILAGMVIVALTAACARTTGGGPVGPGGDATDTPAATAVTVTLTRTGGFAGVNQTVAIAADGSWVYTDAKRQTSDRGRLTDAQRLELVRLAHAPGLFEQAGASPLPTPCADAFMYALDVDGRVARFEDCGRLPQPAVDALIAFIADATAF